MKEAEVSCTNMLQLLETKEIFPTEKMEEIKTKVANILKNVLLSKKKVMMRSAKGAVLSEKVKNSALSLEKTIKDITRHQDAKVKENVDDQLSVLESDVSNVVIYWRSFEAVLT
ncbi:MAG: hypothetical protein JSV20_02185 [Candidatus Bathyarchaeota archaeon]|nr:MAG: hypothetical protein JSV20_02185 [Candidatus Bathyarchaeota archaeon]